MKGYNFVFFLDNNDYQKICYSQLEGRPDVQIVFDWNLKGILKLIHRIHMSPKTNSIFKLPLKKLWYRKYFNNKFSEQRPICFVFDTCLLQLYNYYDYVIFLKNNYPLSKTVLFYQDLIKTFRISFRPDMARVYFDYLISYDKSDASFYNIAYHPTVSSPITVNVPIPDNYKSDVYCLAQAKTRLPLYVDICNFLMKKGVSCKFFLARVPMNERTPHDGITYLDSPMSYIENLKYVMNTNCILEIMQDEAVGYTLRLWEAILYDKKLLTNNDSVKESPFYNDNYICIMKESFFENTINTSFFKDSYKLSNPYKNLVTPINILSFISDMCQ